MSYSTNIIKKTEENSNFRTVLFTGGKSQLVVMSIPPQGEIGEETHHHVEQTLFFLSGEGKAILNGEASRVEALKIYTIYAPANHIDGRVHATKAIADADSEDEAFGEKVS